MEDIRKIEKAIAGTIPEIKEEEIGELTIEEKKEVAKEMQKEELKRKMFEAIQEIKTKDVREALLRKRESRNERILARIKNSKN